MDLIKVHDIEGTMNELMASANVDFAACSSIYKESKFIEGVDPKFIEKFFYHVSNKKDEIYRNEIKKLTNKDKKTVQLYMDDIKENKWNVSQEVILRFEEILADEPGKKK